MASTKKMIEQDWVQPLLVPRNVLVWDLGSDGDEMA